MMKRPYSAPAPSVSVLRHVNSFYIIGTSRLASQFLDPNHNNTSNSGWVNWASGFLRAMNKPILWLGNSAVSGTRTDQFNVDAALASGAANILMDGPINDIGLLYPTQGTVVATALANLKKHIKRLNDAGRRVWYVWERGAGNASAAQMAIYNDFNRQMADYLMYGDDWRGPPDVEVLDPTAATVNTSTMGSTITLKNSSDQVHDNVVAGQLLGQSFANKIAPRLRELPGHRLRYLMQKSGFGTRQLMQSTTGTTAATGTGNSGTAMGNMGFTSNTGGVTAVYSLQAGVVDADGNSWGQDIKGVFTAPAAGGAKLYYVLDRTLITQFDIIRAGFEIDVAAGATGVSGICANLETFPSSGGPTPTYDMFPSTLGTDPGGYSNFVLEPPPMAMGNYVGTPFTNLCLTVNFSAAGSCTVLLRKPWAERCTA